MTERDDGVDGVLETVVAKVEAEPRSGQSLLFYALIKTLDTEQGGHMYMLRKLREFTQDNRPLAYGLMELMAQQGNTGPTWQSAVERIDEAVRGRPYQ